jgi:nitrogen fixation protein FixH
MNAENPALPVTRKPRHWKWPLIVVGLLLGHISIMVTAVVLATSDKSFAVLPDYYQKAVNWDRSQADLRASEKLGWQVILVPSPEVDPTGHRTVTLTLSDAAGQPIANADVEVSAYHQARPNEMIQATFHTDASGQASQALAMRREGFYQIGITARAGTQRFVTAMTPFVSNAKRGPQ